MMYMKKYLSPELEIILFPLMDIVCGSNQGGGGGNAGDFGDGGGDLGGGEDELPVIPF